ncbi:MAG TPA: hypothetical protein VHY37_09790, partial [Tepidisphaeraceae bacterium]|nr:hypothetical protein [Tepidisphaeraceae bacterium]
EGIRVVRQEQPIPHPTDEDNTLTITPICGPVEQLSKDTFAVQFDRIGFDNPKRSGDIWFVLSYSGDKTFKPMAQQAELRVPIRNTKGTLQSITFPAIPDMSDREITKPLQLRATSNLGLPVYYYVREGPAEIDDNGTLTFTPIPPRAKFPIAVTVVAWQWGRAAMPRIQSATPVERTFLINRP